ncbi:hypothetical protein ABW19_dt0207472 [Dactylella cylindrospora]|nr:hypothetical protein ABW19_dt0207472 [Dactylella cylindrospora]
MSSAIIRRAAFTKASAFTQFSARPLSTSIILNKTVTETVKDTANAVNLAAGKTLAAGIDKAEHATEAVKDTVGNVVGTAKNETPTAEEAKGYAQGKAQEVKGEVKGKASEMSESSNAFSWGEQSLKLTVF